jgi:hypothetical protein
VVVVVISSKKCAKGREYPDDHMIGPSLIVERYEDDDIDRKHKNPLPPAELADLYLIVELIYEYSCRREDSQKSDQLQDMEVGDTLDLVSDFATTEISDK